jgi:guanylate cyclase
LFYSILPKNVVSKIEGQDTNIFFSVPSASIIFVSVDKFLEYSYDLSPSQIIETLSLILSRFDSVVENFELITKIRLIGDIYLAVGGLFQPNIPSEEHASQAIKFCLDCMKTFEVLNGQLDTQYQLKIAVHTGGSLIAGVFGNTLNLDIYGNSINIVHALHDSAIPASIHISKATKNLLHETGISIKAREAISIGEDKRKIKTYNLRAS